MTFSTLLCLYGANILEVVQKVQRKGQPLVERTLAAFTGVIRIE